MNTNIQSSDQWVQLEEIKLRGLYLSITVDLDWVLIMIVHECFKSNPKEIETFYKDKCGKGKKLNQLTLFERIEVCKKGIEKYHPNLYKDYKNSLESASKLRNLRNKFAHSKIDTFKSAQDRSELTFHKLKNNFKVEQTIYKVADLVNELENYKMTMQNILRLFSELTNKPEPIF